MFYKGNENKEQRKKRKLDSTRLEKIQLDSKNICSTRLDSTRAGLCKFEQFFGISLFSNDFIRIYCRKLIIFLNVSHRTVYIRQAIIKNSKFDNEIEKNQFPVYFYEKNLDINIFHPKTSRKFSKISINYPSSSIG